MIRKLLKEKKLSLDKKKIKYLVWDFDGTLYQNYKIGEVIKTQYLEYLKNHKVNLSEKSFDLLSKKIGSWGETTSMIMSESELEILNKIEPHFKIDQHLKHDKKIISLIKSLSKYKHVILSNSSEKHVKRGLEKIGFSKNNYSPFEKFFCRNQTMVLKPNPIAFEKVMTYTNLLPINHLMIGDSYHHDIKPALAIGMQAVLIENLRNYLD